MFAVADGFQGNENVPLIGGTDKDGIDIWGLTNSFIISVGFSRRCSPDRGLDRGCPVADPATQLPVH